MTTLGCTLARLSLRLDSDGFFDLRQRAHRDQQRFLRQVVGESPRSRVKLPFTCFAHCWFGPTYPQHLQSKGGRGNEGELSNVVQHIEQLRQMTDSDWNDAVLSISAARRLALRMSKRKIVSGYIVDDNGRNVVQERGWMVGGAVLRSANRSECKTMLNQVNRRAWY